VEYRKLGNSEIDASVVGLGGWAIGGDAWWGPVDEGAALRAIHAAIDLGITLIDTAPVYGFGAGEDLVGRAIEDRRDRVVLATKCGLWWQDKTGSFFATVEGRDVRRSLSPRTIRQEIEGSLRRLRTDWIDLYQVHWPAMEPEKTPVGETMECLMALRREGKIRAVGVCNASIGELEEYGGAGELATDQFRYSMLLRDAEQDVLPWCRDHGAGALTYMSLEQGLLTGKVGMDRLFPPEASRSNEEWNPWYKRENRGKVLDMLGRWSDLLAKYDCSLAQLVLAWTAAQGGVTHVLAGFRDEKQVRENARGGAVCLEEGDLVRIRRDVEALGAPA
jgi:methylglyoxal reductase